MHPTKQILNGQQNEDKNRYVHEKNEQVDNLDNSKENENYDIVVNNTRDTINQFRKQYSPRDIKSLNRSLPSTPYMGQFDVHNTARVTSKSSQTLQLSGDELIAKSDISIQRRKSKIETMELSSNNPLKKLTKTVSNEQEVNVTSQLTEALTTTSDNSDIFYNFDIKAFNGSVPNTPYMEQFGIHKTARETSKSAKTTQLNVDEMIAKSDIPIQRRKTMIESMGLSSTNPLKTLIATISDDTTTSANNDIFYNFDVKAFNRSLPNTPKMVQFNRHNTEQETSKSAQILQLSVDEMIAKSDIPIQGRKSMIGSANSLKTAATSISVEQELNVTSQLTEVLTTTSDNNDICSKFDIKAFNRSLPNTPYRGQFGFHNTPRETSLSTQSLHFYVEELTAKSDIPIQRRKSLIESMKLSLNDSLRSLTSTISDDQELNVTSQLTEALTSDNNIFNNFDKICAEITRCRGIIYDNIKLSMRLVTKKSMAQQDTIEDDVILKMTASQSSPTINNDNSEQHSIEGVRRNMYNKCLVYDIILGIIVLGFIAYLAIYFLGFSINYNPS